MAGKRKDLKLKVIRHAFAPERPPRTAHWVGFSRVGSDVVMDVGFVNMSELVTKIQDGQATPDELHVWVYETFGMSIEAFLRLRANVEEIFAQLQKSDALGPVH